MHNNTGYNIRTLKRFILQLILQYNIRKIESSLFNSFEFCCLQFGNVINKCELLWIVCPTNFTPQRSSQAIRNEFKTWQWFYYLLFLMSS